MGEISKLPNIGKEVEAQLNQVGIETVQQLREIGSKQAWLEIRAIDFTACYNRLCALEGAIQGVRWFYLDKEMKQELKNFYSEQN